MIIIAPYAQKLRNHKENPKNYPYWTELVKLIDEPIIQVGVNGEKQLVDDFRPNLSLSELAELVKECRTWISVDSFFQHFCWDLKKPGIVIWGPSDPEIFGHVENTNILKHRKYLIQNPFLMWEMIDCDDSRFILPEEIIKHL